jgi:ERCC4-type nuclease
MHIVVDSREQKPYWTGSQCMKTSLLVGDYSTIDLINSFSIERKSPQDLYGTILKGHIRFRNEHIRAKDNGIKLVLYVETTKKKFGLKDFPGGNKRQCEGETLLKIISTMESRWPIEVVWCRSRTDCKNKILQRLQQEEKKLKVGTSQRKAKRK